MLTMLIAVIWLLILLAQYVEQGLGNFWAFDCLSFCQSIIVRMDGITVGMDRQDRQSDAQKFPRPCSTYYASSINNQITAINMANTDRERTALIYFKQEAQVSLSDRAMRPVSSNLANYHATVQKLFIRQVLTKPMVWRWRFSWRQCVINKPTTVE